MFYAYGLPHRLLLALEQLLIPIVTRITRVISTPSHKCFVTARTTKSVVTTIRELYRYFNDIEVVAFRKPNVRIYDYYRYVSLDLAVNLGFKPRIVMRG